jgi:hypothetical protein
MSHAIGLVGIVIGELIIFLESVGRLRVKQLMGFIAINIVLCFSQLSMEKNVLDGKSLRETMNLLLWNNI